MGSIVFEVECEVEGRVTPAEPDVGIFGPGVEDADLSSVSMLVYEPPVPFSGKSGTYKSIDLLDGVDDYDARKQIIANIMAAFPTEIDEAILSDA